MFENKSKSKSKSRPRPRSRSKSVSRRPFFEHEVPQNKESEIATNNKDPFESLAKQVDRDLYFDRITRSIIRHPVVGSDGAVYEASSFLQVLQHSGKSLVHTQDYLTSAVHSIVIENTITQLFGEHPDRNEPYDIKPVMIDIKKLLKMPILNKKFTNDLYDTLQIVKRWSFNTLSLSSSLLLIAYIIRYLDFIASGQKSMDPGIEILKTGVRHAAFFFAFSKLGLHASHRFGVFVPRRDTPTNTTPVAVVPDEEIQPLHL